MASGRDLIDASVGFVRLLRQRRAERRLRRRMHALPWSRVADLPEDMLGKLAGVARPLGPVLEAPLSARPCVYYSVEIEDHRRIGGVALAASEQECVRFLLDDDGAHAIVDPIAATFSVKFDYLEEAQTPGDLSPRARELCARRDVVFGAWSTEMLRLREGVIELDQRIAVVGAGVRERDASARPGLYREDGSSLLRLVGAARFPLLISDEPSRS